MFSSNEVIAPGVVANLSPERNRLLIGECDDRASERVARLRAALNEASIESPEVTQIRETIWSKLLTNMSMSVLCLLTGQTARAVRDDPDLAEIVPRLLDEANSIAQSCFPEVKRVTRTGPAPDHKPSILQDYELGRAMEIDVLVRAPAAFARAAGLVDADARHDGGARDPAGARQGALQELKINGQSEGDCIMHVKGKVCVVTGAASGIGEAVARAYAEAGARGVVIADLKTSRDRLAKVAGDIDGLPITADVGLEEDIKALIAAAEDKYGPVDVFFSNAGLSRKGQESASDADWDVSWRVHVMSHVFAARALVPGMLARGSGYLLNTASAAGLLASLNSMPYGVTKNAAVALAEHLAIQYGDRGIRVSVLCPQSVQTGMTTPGPSAARVDGVLQPPEVARMVIEAMAEERFLILSHPQVAEYMQRKASSRDRWLTGMRRLRDKIYGAPQSA